VCASLGMNMNVEVTDIDKHSSLMCYTINYKCKVLLKYSIFNLIHKFKS